MVIQPTTTEIFTSLQALIEISMSIRKRFLKMENFVCIFSIISHFSTGGHLLSIDRVMEMRYPTVDYEIGGGTMKHGPNTLSISSRHIHIRRNRKDCLS